MQVSFWFASRLSSAYIVRLVNEATCFELNFRKDE